MIPELTAKQWQKRAINKSAGTSLLKEFAIPFESKNGGAHLIVDNRFDYWPSTGKFLDRKNGRYDIGVRNLLSQFGIEWSQYDNR